MQPLDPAHVPPTAAELDSLREENTHLRAALATSKDPCVYCQLPAAEQAKCKSGFPGCGRADDQMGCPELGAAMEAACLRAGEDAVRQILVKTYVAAVAGLADAAIIQDQEYSAVHVLAAVEQLAEYARSLRAKLAAVEVFARNLQNPRRRESLRRILAGGH